MFNYYSYQKKKKECLKEKNKKLKDIKLNKINKIKRDELVQKYEQRVKQFIYKISDDPNYLSKNNSLFLSLNDTTTRETENNSFFVNKKFGFNSFETDRMKAEKYDKSQKKLKEIIDKNLSSKNNVNEKYKNHSFSPNAIYNFKMFNDYNKENIDEENNKITQPRLRFKPRNDIERLLDDIKDLRLTYGDRNYLNTLKKQILQFQKNEYDKEIKKRNGLNQFFNFIKRNNIQTNKKENYLQNKIYHKIKNKNNNYKIDNIHKIFNIGHIKNYINSNKDRRFYRNIFQKENDNKTNNDTSNNKTLLDKDENNSEDDVNSKCLLNSEYERFTLEEILKMKRREDINKKKNQEAKIKKYMTNEDFDMKIKDFLIAKQNLHKNYDIKTYFNGMKNYSLWKDSCFIKTNIYQKKNKCSSLDKDKTKSNFLSLTKSPKNTSTAFFFSPEKQRKNNNYSKTFYKIDAKDNLHPEQLVNLLNDYKINDIFELEKKNINNNGCYSNDNKYSNDGININDNKSKLALIKKIAFDKDFIGNDDNYYKTTQNFEKDKKRIFNLNDITEEDNKVIKHLNKDIGEMSVDILKKYGFIKTIYKENDIN